jgi:choline dehydrogenase-like flavoprotein
MEEADIVVIGGGSGGSAVAARLSEDGRTRVALIEAGGRNTGLRTIMPGMIPFQGPATNWAFETVPQPGLNGRRGYQPRGRGLGGSSAINAMLYIRGQPADYDEWHALGCTGWGWDEMLPWFRATEHNERGADAWHGDKGPLRVGDQRDPHPGSHAFVEAAASLQIAHNPDFNGERQAGAGLYQVTQHRGERWSAARAYLADTRHRANLAILLGSHAERICFERGRAVGVAYRRDGRRHQLRARRAVVLAAGAFQTPQLLMLSGIGPAPHLRGHGIDVLLDRPAVGADLQDHLDYVACFVTPGTAFPGRSTAGSLRALAAMARWMATRRGPMTSPFAEAGAFLATDPASARPDVQLHFVTALVEQHGRARHALHGYSGHACLLRPASRGNVRLASPEAGDAPLIDPAYLSAPADLAGLKRGVRAMYRILAAPPLAALGGSDRWPVDLADDAALEARIRARADTIYHPVGTARMGGDADAVCDPRLRVRGVSGLYVADASIMPRLISGNTNAATIVIGERCAAFLRDDLGLGR